MKTNSSPRNFTSGRRVQVESNARSSSGAYTGIRSWDAGFRAVTSKATLPSCGNSTAFAAPRDAGQRQLIRTLTRQILRPVMRNAWALPAGARWKLAWDALRHYPGSIDGRALATLLFKKPLKKENGK